MQIRQEQVYAAVQLHMEEEALDVWAERERSTIRQPSREFEYVHGLDACLNL
jgi:hypothetical protein